jgi:hypothetical protein
VLGATGLDETHELAYRALVSMGAADGPAVPDLVEVVTGAAAVSRGFLRLRDEAREEVCALVTGHPVAASPEGTDAEEQAAERGVRHRVVAERSALDLPDGINGLTAALSRGEQVRVADKVPTSLVIADRSLALVPLAPHTAEPAALVVRASELLALLSDVFESVWRDALPLRLGARGVTEREPDAPDGVDLEVLSLLLAGLTDARVAKHLDLGLRTVQRRVKRLMELTGATTRLQLGWHAYERGWVARERPE